MDFKVKRKIAVAALALLTMTASNGIVSAQDSIPSTVQELADSKISKKIPIPEVRAWETDLNGNTKEVVPLSQRVTPFGPPTSDGFTYTFNTYLPNAQPVYDWHYDKMGIYRYVNGTNAEASIQYEQQDTKSGKWNVSTNLTVSGEFKVPFFTKMSAQIGGSWGMERGWTKGIKYGATQKVNPQTTVYLTNYQVAANSNGKLQWKKYSPSGTQVGVYEETAGGYAVSLSDINIETTLTAPN
ncbi:hypothetical protein [Paenibacillus macerans]|uniref:hypothetical protein n=1 Tax=Paenibacillus macerans TaxID=44252 RepID=UPI0015B2FDE9|nr:hypothetical protein [uncultured Paenibacillus sp.]